MASSRERDRGLAAYRGEHAPEMAVITNAQWAIGNRVWHARIHSNRAWPRQGSHRAWNANGKNLAEQINPFWRSLRALER